MPLTCCYSVNIWCRQKVEEAEEAALAQAHKLSTVLEEKASLEAHLQNSQHQLAAAQAATIAAGQHKDHDLLLLAAQLKVTLPSLLLQLSVQELEPCLANHHRNACTRRLTLQCNWCHTRKEIYID